MDRYIFELSERYNQAFGFLAKNITPKLLNVGFNGSSLYAGVDVFVSGDVAFDEIVLKGSDLELKFGAYPFRGGNFGKLSGLVNEEENEPDIFAPSPMISFSRRKNTKITQIDGSDNEVIEQFGLRAWDIKMQGLLIDMNKHLYPSVKVAKLTSLFETPEIFEVSGELFEDKNIDSIYITGIDISGIPGYEDTQKYVLTARSIKPVEFQLLNY